MRLKKGKYKLIGRSKLGKPVVANAEKNTTLRLSGGGRYVGKKNMSRREKINSFQNSLLDIYFVMVEQGLIQEFAINNRKEFMSLMSKMLPRYQELEITEKQEKQKIMILDAKSSPVKD